MTVVDSKGCSVESEYEISIGRPDDCTGFRTQTQGGWGSKASGNNPGSYRDNNFNSAFPNGVTIGCTNKLKLTTSLAVEEFLPSGSTANLLPAGILTNPGSSYKNVFAGQLTALSLSAGFDNYDPLFSSAAEKLVDLRISSGPLQGLTVAQLLLESNNLIGGCGSSYSITTLNEALTKANENFVDGKNTGTYLVCCKLQITTQGDEICLGETANISASATNGAPPYSYVWSDGLGSGSTKTVTPNASKTYYVTVTDYYGCTKSSSVSVIVNPIPIVNAGNNSEICLGNSIILTSTASNGTPGYTYSWSNGANTASQTVNPTATTTYTVTVTDSKGCTSTDAVIVTVNPLPSVDAGADREICNGFSSTLTAVGSGGTPGYTYAWSNGVNTASQTVSPTATTTYTVTVTDSKGCTSTDAVKVIVNPLPNVDAGADREICYGLSSTLTAVGSGGTPGYTYVWSNGVNTASQTVSPTVTTTYAVTVTDSKGCTSTDAVVVTVNPLPSVDAGADREICNGFSSTLTAVGSGGTPGYTCL